MESLLLMLSPFVVTALTGLIKSLPAFSNLADQARTPAVRVVAAGVTLLYVALGAWITGNVDSAALSTGVGGMETAVVVWVGSLGVFHAFFQKTRPATL
jgi:hypothetical protein